MTELELAIAHLKVATLEGYILLAKMERASKDLKKPPPHIWKHMDVFRNRDGIEMICINCFGSPIKIFCIGQCTGHDSENTKEWLKNAKFLFNIKEKL